jgi:hypothetical protein
MMMMRKPSYLEYGYRYDMSRLSILSYLTVCLLYAWVSSCLNEYLGRFLARPTGGSGPGGPVV